MRFHLDEQSGTYARNLATFSVQTDAEATRSLDICDPGVLVVHRMLLHGALYDIRCMVQVRGKLWRMEKGSQSQLSAKERQIVLRGERALGWVAGESALIDFDDACFMVGASGEGIRREIKESVRHMWDDVRKYGRISSRSSGKIREIVKESQDDLGLSDEDTRENENLQEEKTDQEFSGSGEACRHAVAGS